MLIMGSWVSLNMGSSGWGYSGMVMWESPVFWELRLPRTLMSLLGGGSLAMAGWLMQLYFRNPLASPSILGVTNGASLGVAMFSLIALPLGWNGSAWSVMLAGGMGAMIALMTVVFFKQWIHSVSGLLIFGVMLGHLAGALETIFQQFNDQRDVINWVYWSMGSFEKVNTTQSLYLLILLCLSLFWVIKKSSSLDAWMMGEDFARSMGIPVNRLGNLLVLITGILTAVVTAFCGPVAFIGLAAPHLAKFWIPKRNHRSLVWAVLLTGGMVALYCDILARWTHFPLNAMTSLIGAPFVMMWMIKNKRHAI